MPLAQLMLLLTLFQMLKLHIIAPSLLILIRLTPISMMDLSTIMTQTLRFSLMVDASLVELTRT